MGVRDQHIFTIAHHPVHRCRYPHFASLDDMLLVGAWGAGEDRVTFRIDMTIVPTATSSPPTSLASNTRCVEGGDDGELDAALLQLAISDSLQQ